MVGGRGRPSNWGSSSEVFPTSPRGARKDLEERIGTGTIPQSLLKELR